jgi:hypothetical protein
MYTARVRFTQGFTYSGGLVRPEREVHDLHPDPKLKLHCKVTGCKRRTGRGFSRRETLYEHYGRVHGIAASDTDASQFRPLATDAVPGSEPAFPARPSTARIVHAYDIPEKMTNPVPTPAVKVTPERPTTPDSKAQQPAHNISATFMAPYNYANDTYIDRCVYYPDPDFSNSAAEVQIQGPPSRVGHIGQMVPQAGIASPISYTPALSHMEQRLPSLRCAVPIEDNAQQYGQKRSHSNAFPESTTHEDISKSAKNLIGSYPSRAGGVCDSCVQPVETPDNSNKDEASTESVSGIQALMHRWFDASATAKLFETHNDECREIE